MGVAKLSFWFSMRPREQKVFFARICVLKLNFTAISAHDISTFIDVCEFSEI